MAVTMQWQLRHSSLVKEKVVKGILVKGVLAVPMLLL
jgi:hypothetical protein